MVEENLKMGKLAQKLPRKMDANCEAKISMGT